MPKNKQSCLSPKFDLALHVASDLHATQRRKGSETPYIAHLLGVASIVLEAGGDEEQAIAALLHDAVEDQGGAPVLETIRQLFGQRVAEIVQGCTDTDIKPKPPWRARKEAYIAHLRTAPEDVRLVSLADKIHNARAILMDYRQHGEELWGRFNPDADQIWYYSAILDSFKAAGSNPLVEELERIVKELRELVEVTTKRRSVNEQ